MAEAVQRSTERYCARDRSPTASPFGSGVVERGSTTWCGADRPLLRLLEVSGEADAAALRRGWIHQLADGGENRGGGLVVLSVLVHELVELAGELGVGTADRDAFGNRSALSLTCSFRRLVVTP